MSTTTATEERGVIQEIPIAKIRDLVGARTLYNPETILELAQSIAEHGLLQPIIVRRSGKDQFDLIAGSRRLRAEQQNGKTAITAFIVAKIDDQQALILALTENLHREDLTPFEEAAILMRLLRDHKMTEGALQSKINRSSNFVRQRLALLKLPDSVRGLVSKGQLSLAQADVVRKLPTADAQEHLARAIMQHRLGPQDARQLLRGGTASSVRNPTQTRYVKVFLPVKIITRVQRAGRFLAHLTDEMSRFNAANRKVMCEALQEMAETITTLLRALDRAGKGAENGKRK